MVQRIRPAALKKRPLRRAAPQHDTAQRSTGLPVTKLRREGCCDTSCTETSMELPQATAAPRPPCAHTKQQTGGAQLPARPQPRPLLHSQLNTLLTKLGKLGN